MRPRIFIGFPGIGKSSLKEPGWIDLRSDCFWIGEEGNKIRPEAWYESFCNVAIDLASQGYNIFVPSHEAIRRYLKSKGIDYIVIYPDPKLKQLWITKLYNRYLDNPNRENKSAYEAVKEHWDDFMKDLENEDSIIIHDMAYNLAETLRNEDF